MSKFEQDLMLFHSNDIFVPSRTLFLHGEINEENFLNFYKNLHVLDSTNGTITVNIMSEGGCVTSAKAISDALMSCKNITRGVAFGEIASAATLIFQNFDERVMMPGSVMMIHSGAESVSGHPQNVDNMIKQNRKDGDWMVNTYWEKIKVVKPRFTKKRVKEMLQFDTYLSPKECLDLGLTDRIGLC